MGGSFGVASCLIIEDSTAVREVASELVADYGLEPVAAANAEEGIRLLTQHKPEFMLLDWDLPGNGALDVLTSCAQVGAPRPATILMALENDPKQFALARAAGAETHVLKPFDHHMLLDAFGRAGFQSAR